MGSFAKAAFSVLLGWIRSAIAGLWQMVSAPEAGGLFGWLGDNWLTLTIILCAAGVIIDAVVHLIRWRPYKVWASFFRRLFGSRKEPHPRGGRQRKVQMQWVYADGSARPHEDEPLPEEAGAPGQLPLPENWYVPQQEEVPAREGLSEQYMRQFARPEEENPQQRSPEQLRFQPALDKSQPVQGLEDYPQPPPAPDPEPQPVFVPPERRRKQAVRLQLPRMLGDNEEELNLNYQPVQPLMDKREAYHEPYYPPQWKQPVQSAPQGRRRRAGNGLDGSV